jgi:acetaldehyde dehydrogenase (acetylating)
MTTGVMPSMTLSPGGEGGAITGDNITVKHLFNVKRLAYEIKPPPDAAFLPGSTNNPSQSSHVSSGTDAGQIEEIVRRVLAELGQSSQ